MPEYILTLLFASGGNSSNGFPAILFRCIRRPVLAFSPCRSLAGDNHLHPGCCCILCRLLHQRICPERPRPTAAHRDHAPAAEELQQDLR
uniref:Uncharacterized protein n=1 Tax=Arundo donax TaxID=35708 RepID=A0A0A9BXY1_ARUDO